MDFWLIYTITTLLPSLTEAMIPFAVISGLGLLAFVVVYTFCDEDDRDFPKIQRCRKFTAIVFLITFPLAVLLPGQNQIYKLVGAYYTTNIEDIEKLPPNTIKAINKFLEEYTEK